LGGVGSGFVELTDLERSVNVGEFRRLEFQASDVAAEFELVLRRFFSLLGRWCFDCDFIIRIYGRRIIGDHLSGSVLLTDFGVVKLVVSIRRGEILGADRLGVYGRWRRRSRGGRETSHSIDQLFGLEWLGNDFGAADGYRPVTIEGLEGPGQQDDREVEEIRARFDFLTHVIAVTSRHDDVADHQIRSNFGEPLEKIVTARHCYDFIFRVGKCELNDLLDGEAVVG
jgi:hypothetical protein